MPGARPRPQVCGGLGRRALASVLCLAVTLLAAFGELSAGETVAGHAVEMTTAPRSESGAAVAAAQSYRLGVFPFLPPLSLDRVFAPIVADLSAGLRFPVEFRTKPDFEQFVEEIAGGSYDIIFVHPFFLTYAADRHGYRPAARLKDPFKVVILSRADGHIAGLGDLRGVLLGLPPELAAVSRIMAVELTEAGLVPGVDVRIRNFASKMSCVHAVVIGDVDACGLPAFALRHLKSDHLARLKVAFESRPIANVAFASHPRLEADTHRRLRDRIVAWTETPAGRQILEDCGWSGFVATSRHDYDEIHAYELRLEALSRR